MDTPTTITFSVIGFFVLLAVLVFLRLLLRKGPPHWTELRVGFFIERVPDDEEEYLLPPKPPLQPTTLAKPETE